MRKLWKVCRSVMSMLLVCALLFGLCANGLTVLAAGSGTGKDEILKDFFGEDMSAEEAYDKLLADSAEMNTYENVPFQYIPNKNSYYVALGDETAAKTKKQTSTYVNQLADALGVSFTNLASPQMRIQDVYKVITDNSSTIAKADLITIGFSNFGATYYMCQYMAGQATKVTEQDWIDLVGEENLPEVKSIMDQIFGKISDQNIPADQFGGYDLEGGLECYIYTYMSNAIHQSQVIEAIRVVNSKAAVVLVGTYNDLDGVALSVNGGTMDLGSMMKDLVNSSNYLSVKNANAYDRVAYVDATDVSTALDASKYTTPKQYVFAIVGRQGLPNSDGHKYIKNQILSSISLTCTHTWNEGVVTKEPTCNASGTMRYTCTWCGTTKDESIAATGEHVYATREENRKEPTCGAEGSYDLVTYCTGCGKVSKTEKKTIPATGKHAYGAWVETKAPTCTKEGQERQECKVCGHAQTRTVPATGHKYEAVVTAPTCTEKGYTTYTCACGHSYVADEVAALGHNFGAWSVVKEPSCTAEGEEARTCDRCGHTETRKLSMTEHTYEAVVTAPTCTEKGYTTYTCACGHSYVADEVAALGHNFGTWSVVTEPSCTAEGEEARTCDRCGHTETRKLSMTEHTYEVVVTEPTCTEKGYTTYTCACGHSYVADEVAALGHNWQTTVKQETCCEDGLITSTCNRCGLTETEVTPANGQHQLVYSDNQNGTSHSVTCGNTGKLLKEEELHNFVDGVCDKCGATQICEHQWNAGEVIKAATCCAVGEIRFTCDHCGETYVEQLPVDPTAHTGVNHVENAKDATCTNTGYTGDTICECGSVIAQGQVTPMTEHNYSEWAQTKAPTCTTKGEEKRTCQYCGDTQTRQIDVMDHVYSAVVTDPTCTSGGYTTYICVCGDSYVADEVAALGHAFGQWTVVKEATCTERGQEQRVCERCDHSESRQTDRIEHAYTAVVTDPTCTSGGYTTYTCVCGDSYVADEVAALGHSWQIVIQNENCCENGLITHSCGTCGEVKTELIPANGEHDLVYIDNENGVGHTVSCRNSGKTLVANELHDFVDGTCRKCDAEKICEHQWNDGEVIILATCCTTGEKQYVCQNCGETYTEILPVDPAAHTGVTHVENAKDATCNADGYTGDSVCECGVILEKGEEIEKIAHSFGAWTMIQAPTCTEMGVEKHFCVNCGYAESRDVDMVAHEYKAVVTAPTCTAAGYTTYTCACGDSYVAEEVAALGHSFGQWSVVKAATCTEKGQEKRTCAACGQSETRDVDMVAHEYKAVVTAPTCTAAGYTTYICACGDSYVADEVAALGHSWQTTTKNETCCEDGLTTKTCDRCGLVETEVITANGQHELAYTDNGNGASHMVTCAVSGKILNANELHHFVDGVCDKCGAEEICNHQWNDGEVIKAPTCCATGEKKYTCGDCGETYTELMEKDPTAHTGVNHVENAKEATCNHPGYTGDTVCQCGEILIVGEEIPVKEHTYQAVVTAPTCTTGGYTTYTCTGCGASYVSDHTDPAGHSWDAGVVTKEPTVEAEGEKTYTCTVCGATRTESISKKEPVIYDIPDDDSVTIPENDCFEGGTTVTVEKVEEGEIFEEAAQAMENRAENYMVFEFTATKDEAAVQPNGKLTVTFDIPAEYSTNVSVYYLDENGRLTKLDGVVDANARTVTVELAHFSTYILADEDSAPTVLLGDVNGDGRVNARDARLLLRYIAGLTEEGEVDKAAADFNGDGRVNARDARAILQYIAGVK